MRLSSYLPISAAALLLTFLPSWTVAQTAVTLYNPLPLEVRSPYFNFWSTPYSEETNTTGFHYFFTDAVSDDHHVFPFLSDTLAFA